MKIQIKMPLEECDDVVGVDIMEYKSKRVKHPEWCFKHCENCGNADDENTMPHCKLTGEVMFPEDTCEKWESMI